MIVGNLPLYILLLPVRNPKSMLCICSEVHGPKQFWIARPSKSPPVVRYLLKNKLNELKQWGRPPHRYSLHAPPKDLWTELILPMAGASRTQVWTLFMVNHCMLTWFHYLAHPPAYRRF